MSHLLKTGRRTLRAQIERDVGRSGEVIPPTLLQTKIPRVITISPEDKRHDKVKREEDDDGDGDGDNGDGDNGDRNNGDGDHGDDHDDGSIISTSSPPATASNTKTSPSVTPSTSISQSENSTLSQSTSTVPIGVLIGSVLGTVALMGAVLLICYFRVFRRRRVARLPQPTTTSTGDGVPPKFAPVLSRRAVLEPYMFSTARPARGSIASTDFIPPMRPWQPHNSIAKGGQRYPAAYTSRYTSSTSTALWSDDIVSESTERENGRTGRRAVDADLGSTDTEEEDDRSLPPKYGDVYNIPRSPMFLSRR